MRQRNIFTPSPFDLRKSILPIFDDDSDLASEPRSTYILDLDLPDTDTRLISSPQFQVLFSGSYTGPKTPQSPQSSIEPFFPRHRTVATPPPISFDEVEADCSALQLGSEVIVLNRPRTIPKPPLSYPRSPLRRSPPQSPVPTLPTHAQQSASVAGDCRYQRNAPPPLQLKTSSHRPRSRRYSRRSSRRAPSTPPVPSPRTASHSMTPISINSFRFSYASSKRTSKIKLSTKESHRRRVLKLQRTFGERVPLELVSSSPPRLTAARPLSVQMRGQTRYIQTPTLEPDWALDRIAPAATAKTPCSALKFAFVGDGIPSQRNVLRKSRIVMREKSLQPEDATVRVDEEDGLAEEDLGDNSIWLDDVPPPPRQARCSSLLVLVNDSHENFELHHVTQVQYDDDCLSSPSMYSCASVSPSRSTSAPIYASASPSPSLPAFQNGDANDDADPHQLRSSAAFSLVDAPSPALYCQRMPFALRGSHHSPNPAANAPAPQQTGGFLDVPEGIETTYRSERRQGWSGEWNQPTIQDVIEKLRQM